MCTAKVELNSINSVRHGVWNRPKKANRSGIYNIAKFD